MSTPALPTWAEDVLRRFGPQPAQGKTEPDPDALARYAAITDRFRRRWDLELDLDVWTLFGSDGDRVSHAEPAQHLLGAMIDMARYGSRTEMADKRQALADVQRLEDEVCDLADQLRRKLAARAGITHDHLIEGGLDDEDVGALARAAEALPLQSWREPRLHNTDFFEAISSRKTTRDAVNAMLYMLDGLAPLLLPVILTDRARAAIFNVAHDTAVDEHYSADAIKKARADLRRR